LNLTTVGSTSVLSTSSSAATIKPHVRPLQLPRQAISRGGDRPAVPVPSPTAPNSALASTFAATPITTNNHMNSLRAPTKSLTNRPSPITPILIGHVGTASAPTSPAIDGNHINNATTAATTMTGGGGGICVRPKPRTGTGMVYRTSSYGGGRMRTSLMTSSVVVAGGGVGTVAANGGVPRAIAL
jgi:hypothetical protein